MAFPLRLLTRDKFVISGQRLRGTQSVALTASLSTPKSIQLTFPNLYNFMAPGQILHPRQSLLGCRPTRSWQRFLLAVYKAHHDKKLRSTYPDSYVIGFYPDTWLCTLLPGLAKNSPAPTRTATN
jgi:hypothetical protein